jgi:hypothetical protein
LLAASLTSLKKKKEKKRKEAKMYLKVKFFDTNWPLLHVTHVTLWVLWHFLSLCITVKSLIFAGILFRFFCHIVSLQQSKFRVLGTVLVENPLNMFKFVGFNYFHDQP